MALWELSFIYHVCASYCVNFVEGFPPLLGCWNSCHCLDGSFKPWRPNADVRNVLWNNELGQSIAILAPSGRQIRVPTDATHKILLALSMLQIFDVGIKFNLCLNFKTNSGQVDCPRYNVNVHQVVDNPALNVTLVFVDHYFFTCR